MAKFISKHANYRAILRPGILGNRSAGTPDIAGVWVKFEGGVAVVDKPELIEMMKKHGGYGKDKDFILVEDSDETFVRSMGVSEPGHVIQEMDHGSVGKRVGETAKNPELNKQIKEAATKIAGDMMKELLPDLAKEMAKKMFEEHLAKQNAGVGDKSSTPAKTKKSAVVGEKDVEESKSDTEPAK